MRVKEATLSISFIFLYNLYVFKTISLLFVNIDYKIYFYYVELYALSTLITLFFLFETKELTLKEIDTLFKKTLYIVWFGRYRVDSATLANHSLANMVEIERKAATNTAVHVEALFE